MERAIVHMDLDTFFVSCERLNNDKLRGVPVIIGGGERGVVASCSYEARYFGVHSAMPIKMALRLCPEAKVIKGDMERYSKLSHMVTEVIEEKAPVVEKASMMNIISILRVWTVFLAPISGRRNFPNPLPTIRVCRSALRSR